MQHVIMFFINRKHQKTNWNGNSLSIVHDIASGIDEMELVRLTIEVEWRSFNEENRKISQHSNLHFQTWVCPLPTYIDLHGAMWHVMGSNIGGWRNYNSWWFWCFAKLNRKSKTDRRMTPYFLFEFKPVTGGFIWQHL